MMKIRMEQIMMKTLNLIMVIFVCIVSNNFIYAQMSGQPVGVQGSGEWTIGVSANYIDQLVVSDRILVKRILIKSSWGLLPWLDIYGTIGKSDIKVKLPQPILTSFHDNSCLTYGVGLSLVIKKQTRTSPIGLWIGAQAIRFFSDDDFLVPFGDVILESQMNSDWRELQGIGGLIYRIKNVHIYMGGVGWMIQRLDEMKQFEYASGTLLGKDKGELVTSLWTGGMVGFEFRLPKRYAITVECLAFNLENYHIRFGVSQTGSP